MIRMQDRVTRAVKLNSNEELYGLFGRQDENLRYISRNFGITITAQQTNVLLQGRRPAVERAWLLIQHLLPILRKDGVIKKRELELATKMIKKDSAIPIEDIFLDRIAVFSKKHFISPKTQRQKEYVDSIRNYDITFAIGPAGTGKTYLAMACAVSALKRQRVSRIILTRPAVEAGESLGYLPGTLDEKISPYLRPLYDALHEMMEPERIEKCLETGVIEVAPLAYMRGRTLNDSFVILDEAQNCTREQMKMFLTRLGFDSKTVITGDITQSDLEGGRPVGLIQAQEILSPIKGISFVRLSGQDVVRHELIQEIIKAYEKIE